MEGRRPLPGGYCSGVQSGELVADGLVSAARCFECFKLQGAVLRREEKKGVVELASKKVYVLSEVKQVGVVGVTTST